MWLRQSKRSNAKRLRGSLFFWGEIMRRIRVLEGLLFLTFALLVGGHRAQAAQSRYVYDHAGVLSPMTIQKIDQINKYTLAELPGKPVLPVEIYKKIPGNEATADYKVRRFEQLGIGRKGWDNGLYFVMATETHKYGLATGYGLESALPDAEASNIVTPAVKTRLRSGDYDTAVMQIVASIRDRLVANRSAIMTPADIAAHRRKHALIVAAVVIVLLIPVGLIWRHRRRTRRLRTLFVGGINNHLPLYQALSATWRERFRHQVTAPWFAAMPQAPEIWLASAFMRFVRINLGALVADMQPSAPEPLYVYQMLDADALRSYDDAGKSVPTLEAYLRVVAPAFVTSLAPVRQYMPAFTEWAKSVALAQQQAVWAAFAQSVQPQDAAQLADPATQKLVFTTILADLNGEDVSATDWALMPLWVQTDYDSTDDSDDDHDDFGSGGGFDGDW